MSAPSNTAIPKGSLVLVTAVNGYIGSAIADYFLQNGFKVRGTVRDTERAAWVKTYFDKHYPGNFEVVQVSNMTVDGAFDEVAKGTAALIHVASDVSFGSDPNQVIPVAIKGAVVALKSAYATPSVKRFVLTSSSAAAVPNPSEENTEAVDVTEDTWNESAVKAAWADPPYLPQRGGVVYAASKTQAEQEVWKFHKENKEKRSDLVVNTILPNMNYGKILDVKSQGYPSSSKFIHELYEGRIGFLHTLIGNQFYIDVTDTAALHYAATVLPDVKEERIFGFGGWYTWNKVLDILRKNYPEQPIPAELPAPGIENNIKPRARAEQLLRELGHPGWTSLEDTLKATISST